MPRKPASSLETVSRGQILSDLKAKRDLATMHPDRIGHLGVARVTLVNYEEFYVTLRILIGSQDEYERVPVPMVFPGAGARHFFGAMPEVGDHCIVGWMPQESSDPGGTKTPVILGWVIPGTWAGREWFTTAGFTNEEYDLGTAKKQEMVRGVFDRVRHKLRAMQPGMILASSSQGSDLVLNEGVLLSNRRGNELRLRDQDQALVVRSLQQFHAMAGARIYSGMVQRDATFLATTMVSDGKEWDGPIQSVAGEPLREDQLPASDEPEGFLTPASILARASVPATEGYLGAPVFKLSPRLDPYTFLKQGGFLDESGFVVDTRHRADAVYGGKPMFRVAAQSSGNAVLDPDAPTLTEWRLELTHTSDGRLPVTEQTDMFDAERLPRSEAGMNDPSGSNPNTPFLEQVYGSVVGNDPYSPMGRQRYGVPLQAVVFDGNQPNPRLDPVKLVADSGAGGTSTPLGQHAAMLFRLAPIGRKGPDTFWSVNKAGQLRASIGGPVGEYSVEAALQGGLKLSVGGKLDLMLSDGVSLGSKTGDKQTNVGVQVVSEKGAVRIYGGGSIKGAEALGERLSSAASEGALPSVDIKAETSARIEANRNLTMRADQIQAEASTVGLAASQNASLRAADRLVLSGKVLDLTSGGKRTEMFTGPKDGLPSNGALHEVIYVAAGGVAQQTTYNAGDRKESFVGGNHETSLTVGNMAYRTGTGTFTFEAGSNSMELSKDSFKLSVLTPGGISLQATEGEASLKGLQEVSVESLAGTVTVRGALGVHLGGPVDNNMGPILCAGTIDPLTGLPYTTWGMGAKKHTVGL